MSGGGSGKDFFKKRYQRNKIYDWIVGMEKKIDVPFEVSKDFLEPINFFFSNVTKYDDIDEIPGLNIRLGSIKTLTCKQWVNDSVIELAMKKFNTNQKRKVFCFKIMENYIDGKWSDLLIQRFKKSFPEKNAETIVIFLNVGSHYYSATKSFSTYIGEGIDENGTQLVACHYAVGVINLKSQTIKYCDSLGWDAPFHFKDIVFEFLREIGNCTDHYSYVQCHESSLSRPHNCVQGCSMNYPLQTCGTVCGVSAIITGAIAVYCPDSFDFLTSSKCSQPHKLSYLRNISKYSDFLRVCILRWMIGNKSLMDDIKGSPLEIPFSEDKSSLGDKSSSRDKVFSGDKASAGDKASVGDKNSAEDKTFSGDKASTGDKNSSGDKTSLGVKLSSNKISSDTVASSFTSLDGCANTVIKISEINSKKVDHGKYVIRCLGKICNLQDNHFHCFLCNEEVFSNNYYAKRHLENVHLSEAHYVVYKNLACLPCKSRTHTNPSARLVYHFHCPVCKLVVKQKCHFKKHLLKHMEKSSIITSVIKGPSFISKKKGTIKYQSLNTACPHCGLTMREDSLKRHLRTKHKDHLPPQSVCVDYKNSIFMVKKNETGIPSLIHVQKLLHGSKTKVFCENKDCSVLFGVSSISGLKEIMCSHLKKVDERCLREDVEDITQDDIAKIMSDETIDICKIIKPETAEKCIEILSQASSVSSKPIVKWVFPNYIHLSVFSDKVHYNAKLGRFVVTYNRENGQFDCGCCQRNVICKHKALALFYLKICRLLTENIRNTSSSEIDVECNQGKPIEPKRSFYPPKSCQETLDKMCKYILQNKKYSRVDIENSKTFNLEKIPRNFIPFETHCHFCQAVLGPACLVSSKARIISLSGIHVGFSSYVKQCKNCNVFYRYQEGTDGVHNFDDLLFLAFEVCLFLREHVQQANSINSFVEILSRLFTTNLNKQAISNSYLLFDLLSSSDRNFKCNICGDNPWAIVTDVNRKIAFKCSFEEINDLNEDLDSYNGEVNMNDFWEKVELDIIRRSFTKSLNCGQIKPNFSFWAPFMNPSSRTSNILHNTEHKKMSSSLENMEEDFRELSEERILEMLSHDTAVKVRSTAKSCGISNIKGSKIDILMRIKSAINKDSEKFKNIFTKLWGHSGGWLTFSCLHGIVYYVKFLIRAESCRDYVDGLLSFKHIPNVVIVDMAHILARHANTTRKADTLRLGKGDANGNLFFPFDGRIADHEDPAVLADAIENKLKMSFPWMDPTNHLAPGEVTEPLRHPVTGSGNRFCLFDRFHEGNTSLETEVLRRVTNIDELNGIVNTQVEEQLHLKFRKFKHFLNMMQPVSHIFLFRSILSHYNDHQNDHILKKFQLNQNQISFDSLGRLLIGNKHP